ncbi:[FeFe] hydrogenase H-cluster maturation GTPase HydF [Wukongibacter sp. M2B1]|uniref:[FeFe] hydrogenase H-cluster maturation GTPase HydF n=1 Tax=Wukongibacter sp. M2B1 TaxID=3088895 RepID=UPI003D7A9597
MNNTPMGFRLHIAIFGRRNVGKSTLINAVTNQQIAIVSDVAGTTTDPVFKTMELLPIGPVVMIDTAGLDDVGELGALRKEKTYEIMDKTNFAVLVLDAEDGLTPFEKELVQVLKKREIPSIGVINKCDLYNVTNDIISEYKEQLGIPITKVSSKSGEGIEELKGFIADNAIYDESQLDILRDFISPGDTVVLITHIDCAAPKGRIILPQQQTIRDVIESGATAIVTQEKILEETLNKLKEPPRLVVTDSLVSDIVEPLIESNIKFTSFSILIGRQKGSLKEYIRGLKRIKKLKEGSRILIAETCTHRRQERDLAMVQIPQYVKDMTGKEMCFEWASGTYFPRDIERFDGIIHCGGCTINKQEMASRIRIAREENIPITNYGMLITCAQGIVERLLEPFPLILDIYQNENI